MVNNNHDLIKKADEFLKETDLFHKFCIFTSDLFVKSLTIKDWKHSDRWSAIYNWLKEQTYDRTKSPEAVETALTEWYEWQYPF